MPRGTARLMPEADGPPDGDPAAGPPGSLFHEPWWLAAATRGRCEEVTVAKGNRIVGRLPFVVTRRMGFTSLRMPPFTHVLGPLVDAGAGKSQTQLATRLSVIRELLDGLPRFDHFKQAMDTGTVDGLAFQDRGFEVRPQFTFLIDCQCDTAAIWEAMHFKTRQHIRRAGEKFAVVPVDAPARFLAFYQANARRRGFTLRFDPADFETLFHECRARDCGEIICASRPDGTPTAMIFIVWGHGTMYYLMSTRAGDQDDNGSISLLIWEAIRRANGRGLALDLDGVISSGTARFLGGFGGRMKVRWIAQRTSLAYATLQRVKRGLVRKRESETLTFT